jgi:aminopeptidase S
VNSDVLITNQSASRRPVGAEYGAVRFFGHEEDDLQGWVATWMAGPPDHGKKIKLYLDVDMVASPNGGYFVHGGKGSDEEEAGPAGSATIA